MSTVTHTTRIIHRSFYAVLYDQNGQLTRVNNALVFLSDDDELTILEPDMVNFLIVLGEVDLADTQHLRDRLAGGAAAICTSRLQEVA